MRGAKRIADAITMARLLLGIGLVWLGWSRGRAALEWAVWIMIAGWTGDCIDGPIARRSRPYVHTWVGDHDLEVDMAVAGGLLGYLAFSGFVDPRAAGAYLLLSILLFRLFGRARALGMLFQAPVYGGFIWISLQETPAVGWALPAWILAAVVLTWPRFPREIVPGFLEGMRRLRVGARGPTRPSPGDAGRG